MLAVGGLVVSATMSNAEIAEGVLAAIAAYTHALDDGRTDDVVASYCPDGVFDMPGTGTFEGHAALREASAAWAPRKPHPHLVVNTPLTHFPDPQDTAPTHGGFIRMGRPDVRLTIVAPSHRPHPP